jgi:hypothetical protein
VTSQHYASRHLIKTNCLLLLQLAGGDSPICLKVDTIPPKDFSVSLKALMNFRGSAATGSLTLLKLWGVCKEELHRGTN